jgi:hypothetical protein
MKLLMYPSIVLLTGVLAGAAAFTPSSICVDIANVIIKGPEADGGFSFGDNYIYKAIVPPASKVSAVLGTVTYAPTYNSSDYSAYEETVENYNRIGEKPGTHWVTCVLQRNVEYITVPATKTVQKVFTAWITSNFPQISSVIVGGSTEPVKIPTGTSYSFVWKSRDRISNVHTFDPATGTDGIAALPALSDVPSLKKIINITSATDAYTSGNCLASAYVLLGNGDSDPWNRPVIVSDGFDPRERISIQEILENVENSLTPNAYQFAQILTSKGYDLIFVDPASGGKDIVANGRIVLKVIEEVCSRAPGTVMVGGYSMGGLIARTALLLGEKNNLPCMSKISRYVSIDSPHLGAQINNDMQKKVVDICNARMSNPISYLSYEAVATIGYDLKCDAARQLLFKHTVDGTASHDAFYSFLQSMGDFPSKPKCYAIGDAAWINPYPGINPETGALAAYSTGTSMTVKGDDLAPGAYIDLWASGKDANPGSMVQFGAISTINIGYLKNVFGELTIYPPTSTHYGDTRYKPTFIPLYSALGIGKSVFQQLAPATNQEALDQIARTYSPFDKIYLVSFTDRCKHIVFDNNLADKVIKTIKPLDMSAILQLLLD